MFYRGMCIPWLAKGGAVDSQHRNLLAPYMMDCELLAEDEKPSAHLLEMLVSHNFLVMVHGFKDILCKMNILNTKLQSSGVTYNTECDVGMSVEDVPAIVNIKTLKGRLIAHKFNTGWWVWCRTSPDYNDYLST